MKTGTKVTLWFGALGWIIGRKDLGNDRVLYTVSTRRYGTFECLPGHISEGW